MNTASVQIFFWSLICLSPADCCGFGAYRGGPFPRPRSFEGGRGLMYLGRGFALAWQGPLPVNAAWGRPGPAACGGGTILYSRTIPLPPVGHSVSLLFLYGALDSHPFFPSHVALVAAFCRPLRQVLLLVSFPRSWSPAVGVLDVASMCRLRVSGAQ